MRRLAHFGFILATTLYSCKDRVNAQSEFQNNSAFTFRIFNNDTAKTGNSSIGYGYDILKNGNLYIHQPIIPAVQGTQGFNTLAKAQKTAKFILYKIEHNIIPPSVTSDELDSLKVLDIY